MRKSGKKLVSAVMAAAMVLSLAACGGKTADTTTAATEAATTEAATTEAETTAAEETEPAGESQQADIVVIGAGGAGMTAAIQAVQDGATDVVVLEKMPITGGNTTRSTGGLNACATKYQEAEGIEDSVDLFVEDTMKGGKELNNKELVTVMAENSAAAVDWVNEIGGDLSVVGMFGGASVKRIHRPTDTSAVGPMLVKALNNKMAELNIPVLLETTAKQILVNDEGAVCGVVAADKDGKEMTIDCTASNSGNRRFWRECRDGRRVQAGSGWLWYHQPCRCNRRRHYHGKGAGRRVRRYGADSDPSYCKSGDPDHVY